MNELTLLLLQIGVVLVASRLFGVALRWMKQPLVVAEIMAGIALGPSLLGWMLPRASASLFGLMELIVLNIGLDLHIISPTLFTMMVLMALVTTVATSPVLEWVYPDRELRRELGARTAVAVDRAASAAQNCTP